MELACAKISEYGALCILLPFVKEDVPVKESAPAIPLYVPHKLIAVLPIVIAEFVILVLAILPVLSDAVILPLAYVESISPLSVAEIAVLASA